MLEALTTAVPHVVHLRCGGHITLDDLNRGIEAIEEALARTPRLHCLVEVEPLEQIDPAALWRDVLYGVSKLGSLHRFPRVAVVTDLSWIRTAAQIEHHLFPFITIRTFEAREMEAAQAWVAAEPSKPETAPPAEAGQGFVEVPTDDANVLAFEVDGRPTDAQIEAIVERLNAAYDAAGDGKVNLLCESSEWMGSIWRASGSVRCGR